MRGMDRNCMPLAPEAARRVAIRMRKNTSALVALFERNLSPCSPRRSFDSFDSFE